MFLTNVKTFCGARLARLRKAASAILTLPRPRRHIPFADDNGLRPIKPRRDAGRELSQPGNVCGANSEVFAWHCQLSTKKGIFPLVSILQRCRRFLNASA